MISNIDLFVRLLLAVILGSIVGFERERKHKTAGFRTNILICLGAALFTIVSINLTYDYTKTVADPGRIAAQIVTGIGFLGAGAILRSRGSVVGMTTAASIWVTAAVGLAVGCGYYIAACLVAVMTVVILQAFVPFVFSMRRKWVMVQYYLEYTRNPELDRLIKQFYEDSLIKVDEIQFEISGDMTVVRLNVNSSPAAHEEFRKKFAASDPEARCIYF